MTPQETHLDAINWQKTHFAKRHVRLLKRIGRAEWIKTYNTQGFSDFVGTDNFRDLKLEMARIMSDARD